MTALPTDAPPTFFDRVVKVTVARAQNAKPGGFIASAYSFFDPQPNGLELTDVRVQFSIEKTIDKTPNKADIKITNLSTGTRAQVVQTPGIVRLDAGYKYDVGAQHVFTGDLLYGWSAQDNTEWYTTLQCHDGGRAYIGARVNQSYRAGSSVMAAVKACAASMGLALPPNVLASSDLQKQFASGRQILGSASNELARLLAPYGYSFSIQDGQLQILRDDQARKDTALLISQQTGMLGSPEFGPPQKKGKPPTLKIKCILYPAVTAGGLINVQADDISGTFRAERVTHVGDTHGEDWYTEIEAKRYGS